MMRVGVLVEIRSMRKKETHQCNSQNVDPFPFCCHNKFLLSLKWFLFQ